MAEIIIPFGGGVHSRASEADINDQECSQGVNFSLDPENREFRNRKPFDLIGTVPNGAEIRGLVSLYKRPTSAHYCQASNGLPGFGYYKQSSNH